MSELKEKVLSEISFAMVDDVPDLQKLYDKVAAIDEQPELNGDQRLLLDWFIKHYKKEDGADPLGVICAAQMYGLQKKRLLIAALNLNNKQQAEIMQVFSAWVQEQEEAECY